MTIVLNGTTGITTPTTSTTGEFVTSVTGFKNRLINGSFQIWQRGTSFTATGYGADRFIFSVGGTATFTKSSAPTSPNGNYYATVTTGAASSFGNFTQAIETANVLALRGKTVTATAWVQGTGVAHSSSMVFVITYSNSSDAAASQGTTVTQTVTVPVAPTSTWQQAKATFVVPSDAVGLAVSLNNGAVQASGVVVSVADFQLEVGSTATSFDYRPYGTELQLAQRYYWSGGNGFSGVFNGATTARFSGAYPVPMRAVPTVTATTAPVALNPSVSEQQTGSQTTNFAAPSSGLIGVAASSKIQFGGFTSGADGRASVLTNDCLAFTSEL